MTSRHHKWQARWQIDRPAALATHESGLRVSLQGGQVRAVNGATLVDELAKTHGGHNAPRMLARLLREAAQLFAETSADAPHA